MIKFDSLFSIQIQSQCKYVTIHLIKWLRPVKNTWILFTSWAQIEFDSITYSFISYQFYVISQNRNQILQLKENFKLKLRCFGVGSRSERWTGTKILIVMLRSRFSWRSQMVKVKIDLLDELEIEVMTEIRFMFLIKLLVLRDLKNRCESEVLRFECLDNGIRLWFGKKINRWRPYLIAKLEN